MQKFLRDPSLLGRGYPIIGANSEVLATADPLYINSSGFLATVAAADTKFIGYYTGQGETMSSDNETVAKVTPDYVYADNVEMVFGSDQDCVQTDVGAYADFGTYTTGAYELNLSAGSTGLMLVLGFDPEGESDDDAVVVTIAEPQRLAF